MLKYTGVILAGIFASTALAGWTSSAHAQAAALSDAQRTTVEEIVVTARKQAETLQSVPVTVTAFSAASVDKLQVKNVFDLVAVTPGLYYATTGGRNGGNKLQIRNLSTGTSGGSKGSVFIDGVYMSGDYASTPFANLERVEVLKGPQSAAYGRSTFVGAVNYITRDPGAQINGKVDALFGQLGERDITGFLSGPIVGDMVSDIIAFRYYDYTGDEKWLNQDGYHFGDQSTRSVSNKLVVKPTDDLTVRLYTSYVHDHDHIQTSMFGDLERRGAVVQRPDGTQAYYYTGGYKSMPFQQPYWHEAINGYMSDPGVQRDQFRYVLSADYKFAGQTLSSFFSQSREVVKNQFDASYVGFGAVVLPNAFGVPTRFTYNAQNQRSRVESKDTQFEVRLAAPSTWRLRYLVGLNYIDLDGDTQILLAPVSPAGVQLPTTVLTKNDNWIGGNPARDESVFGGLYYDVTPKLIVSLEARRQRETITSINYLSNARYKASFSATLPRVNVQYKFTPNFQIYGVYSKGNNPGGFNSAIPVASLPASIPVAYGEESLTNYEAGVKSVWLNGRLLVNAAVFHMDWDNQQVLQSYITNYPTLGLTSNLTTATASSKVDGFEAEVVATPAAGLSLRSTVGYGKAVYKDYCSSNYFALTGIATSFGCRSVAGKQQEGTPALQLSFAADYTHALRGEWSYFLRGDYAYQSKLYTDEWNQTWLPAVGQANARIGVENGRWTAELFVRNILDEEIGYRAARVTDIRTATGAGYPAINGISQSSAGGQNISIGPRKPRQFGIRLAAQF